MATSRHRITARVREFQIPPIHDGLVLGKDAAIGCVAMRQALGLLSTFSYSHIEIKDEIISDILLKEGLLKRIPRDKLITFILDHVKPHLAANEILHIDFDAELLIESLPT